MHKYNVLSMNMINNHPLTEQAGTLPSHVFQTPGGQVARLFDGDALDAYASWPAPSVIVSDGPYGISGYPGDASSPNMLAGMYEPHVRAWSERATPSTTLWFWNTEVGWAMVHPVLVAAGWVYRGLNVWDKGVSHIAGNCNGKTMRKFPVVTEVCAHYVREPRFFVNGAPLSLQDWFRAEWKRTGLPFSAANAACGVRNAASRKYLASDHLWYAPPPEVFARLSIFANEHGQADGRPYFNLSEEEMDNDVLATSKWEKMQATFNFEYGVTNVWQCPSNRGRERLKDASGQVVHSNQKPDALMERIILASSQPADMVWDVFCGTAAGSLSALRLGRSSCTAESNPRFQDVAKQRLLAATVAVGG